MISRIPIGLVLAAALAVSALPASSIAVAATRPAISAPVEVAQGQDLLVTVSKGGKRSCSLVTTSPAGKKRTTRLPARYRYGFRLVAPVRGSAERGAWKLQVRCGGRSSRRAEIWVGGTTADSRGPLFKRVQARAFYKELPKGLGPPDRNQNSDRGPKNPKQDGLGATAGDRGAGALEWAQAQMGRTDYYFWCLKFVAHAYGAQAAGFETAQDAADALGTRDPGNPAAAPAGSLMFFHYEGDDGVQYGHVGLSLGDGRMVSALQTVRIDDVRSDPYWSSNYLGWAEAPTTWPGRPSSKPPEQPPPPPSKVLTVDNRVTNGSQMREDPAGPATLSSKPWIRCRSRGCEIPNTGRSTGQTFESAICQTRGERTTNGNDSDPADDNNPERYESTLYYGVRLADGTFGYLNEVWVNAKDRGGASLPNC